MCFCVGFNAQENCKEVTIDKQSEKKRENKEKRKKKKVKVWAICKRFGSQTTSVLAQTQRGDSLQHARRS